MRLSLKLLIAFMGLIIFAIALTGFLVNFSLNRKFQHYIEKHQLEDENKLVKMLADFYAQEGTFPPQDEYRGYFCMIMDTCVMVEDMKNKSVLNYCQGSAGDDIAHEHKYTRFLPIELNGVLIGNVSLMQMHRGIYSEEDLIFKRMINRNILLSGGISLCIAFLMSLLFSYILLKPVREMAGVAEDMGDGDFSRRVDIKSRDELGSLGATLNKMAENIARHEMLKKKITGNIAHELRTPLSIVQSHLEAFEDGVMEMSKDKIKSLHEEILGLARLVNELQELSLAESGELVIRKEPLNLVDLVKKIKEKLTLLYQEKGIAVRIVEKSQVPPLMLDPEHTERIFTNILQNSYKYTPSGGNVTITLAASCAEAIISIEDSGVGIPPSELPHIFERFYRIDSPSSRSTNGMGLGLAIARELIIAQNGKIDIRSRADEGTEVIICFPAGS